MRVIYYLVIICLCFLSFEPVVNAAESVELKDGKAAGATEEQKATYIKLFSLATIVPKALIDLQSRLEKDQDVLSIEEALPALLTDLKEMQWEAKEAGTNPDLQLIEVSTLQTKTHRLTTKFNNLRKPLTRSITELSAEREKWQKKKSEIDAFNKSDIESFPLAQKQLQTLLKTVDTASKLIEDRLALALRMGKKTGDVQIVLHEMETDLKELAEEKLAISVHQTSPSMLSPEFYEKLKPATLVQAYTNFVLVVKEQRLVFAKYWRGIVMSFLALLLLSYLLHRSRTLVSTTSLWHPFATCHIATAVFLATSLHAILDMMGETFRVPHHWQSFFHILMLLAVTRLTSYIIQSKWQRGLLIPLTLFMVLLIVMVIIDLPQIFMLLYVFYISLVALLFYLLQLCMMKGLSSKEKWLRRALGILPAVVVISGIFGYDQFAVILFSTLLSAITASLIIWVMYVLCLGVLDLFLSVIPFELLKENRVKIITRLKPIVASMHILLFIAIQLVVWDFFGTVNGAMLAIFNQGIQVGGVNITPGFLIAVILILYCTLLLSRGIQALLLSKVLPAYGAEKGVQLSIARLVHYAILLVGFLFLLSVLGFKLNQLTILGGALGVGIGFGLQAIVNNFASGLILLFERPIKVGDTVQIGTELGEVKNMGLRATVIQTFDNAEIVVPNSDLITGQVTNWTLAERKVRVRVNVGVAYGSEVEKVLQILRSCANNNPMVLNTPAPVAFFLAFGASSLDFELRVWIPEFLDKTQVLSDLNQDIENEFAINDIEVPFPQTDLHVRSVDADAAQLLGAK